jgi:deoxyadenosine/deoxycytidine kinase
MPPIKVTLYTIQGNIGAGKSEVIRKIQKEGHPAQTEPINEWKQLLDRKETERGEDFELHLQTRICISITSRENDKWLVNGKNILFRERNLDSAIEVFIPTAVENKNIGKEGQKTLESLCEKLKELKELKTKEWEGKHNCEIEEKTIYVRTTPTECLRRIRERGQSGDQYITQKYIDQLHEKHEKWLGRKEGVIEVDGEKTMQKNKIVEELLGKD